MSEGWVGECSKSIFNEIFYTIVRMCRVNKELLEANYSMEPAINKHSG